MGKIRVFAESGSTSGTLEQLVGETNFPNTSGATNLGEATASCARMDDGTVFVAYRQTTGKMRNVSFNGTNAVTVGSELVFSSGAIEGRPVTARLSSTKVIVVYRLDSDDKGYYVVYDTASNTFGTPVAFTSVAASDFRVAPLGNGRVLIGYQPDPTTTVRNLAVVTP